MKFVKTTRQFRTGVIKIENRATLNPDGTYSVAVSEKQFNDLAIAFEHGVELHIYRWVKDEGRWNRTNTYTVLKKQYPTKEWHYDMVSTLPSTYVAKKINTPQEAYDFGKKLIDAVYKNNRLPYDVMITDYMQIARALEKANVTYSCKNETIRMTVRAELETANDITNLQDYKRTSTDEYLPEEVNYLCRAFDIEVPTWFLKYSLVKTKHGWAQLPKLTTHVSFNSGKNDYAGNLDENGAMSGSAPYTLLRDATPVPIKTAQLDQLMDTISWYRNLSIEDQRSFLTENFEINDRGEITEHNPEDKEKAELEIIEDTMQAIQNGTICYDDYD